MKLYLKCLKMYIGTKYNYSEVIYKNNKTKVKIECSIHGYFEQAPQDHLTGKGCSKCSKYTVRWNTISFIERVSLIHKFKYTYEKTVYTTSKNKVIITCKKHGDFYQGVSHHINGHGCPTCGICTSLTELKFITLLETLDVLYIQSYRPSWLKKKELDIYIPEYNLAIEINGFLYHHSTKNLTSFAKHGYKSFDYHLNKYEQCQTLGINLLHIFDFEDIEKWLELLKLYLITPESYNITFNNNYRCLEYRNQTLQYYGQSFITLI